DPTMPQQDPTQMPGRTSPTRGIPDQSTAQTAGEMNRAMNQANDAKFAADAAMGSMAEVKLGQLAAEKATNPDVKQFGQRMVDDHTKIGEDLKAAAAKESIKLPDAPSAKQQATYDRLFKLSGTPFD